MRRPIVGVLSFATVSFLRCESCLLPWPAQHIHTHTTVRAIVTLYAVRVVPRYDNSEAFVQDLAEQQDATTDTLQSTSKQYICVFALAVRTHMQNFDY